MSASRLAGVGLLLTWPLVQICLAGPVQQDGPAGVYSTVDSDGVTLFTNIPAAGGALAPRVEPAASQGMTRSTQPSANEPLGRVMVPTAKRQAPHQIELPNDSGAAAGALDQISVQLGDGGLPPDDH